MLFFAHRRSLWVGRRTQRLLTYGRGFREAHAIRLNTVRFRVTAAFHLALPGRAKLFTALLYFFDMAVDFDYYQALGLTRSGHYFTCLLQSSFTPPRT